MDVQGLRRLKDVGIGYHYVRQMVADAVVKVVFTPLEKEGTDSVTKVLGRDRHSVHRYYLGVFQEPPTRRRGVLRRQCTFTYSADITSLSRY